MARRFYPTPCEMDVKRGFKPTAEPAKTEEKLKNPQQPTTRAVESQEGLKQDLAGAAVNEFAVCRTSRRVETRGLSTLSVHTVDTRVESQEGLKRHLDLLTRVIIRPAGRISRRVATHLGSS